MEIYELLVKDGFDGIAHYTAAELGIVADYLRRTRQL